MSRIHVHTHLILTYINIHIIYMNRETFENFFFMAINTKYPERKKQRVGSNAVKHFKGNPS